MEGASTFDTINEYITVMFGSDIFDRVQTWLSLGTDGPYATIWSTVQTIYGSLTSIGVGLMMLFLSIRILSDLATTGPPTFEMIFKHVARLLIGYVVISHGLDILQGIVGFSDDLFDQIQGSLFDNTKWDNSRYKELAGMFFPKEITDSEAFKNQEWGAGATMSEALSKVYKKLPWYEKTAISMNAFTHKMEQYVAWGADIYVIVVCMGRAVQICAYTMVSPLAFADCVSGGDLMSSHAFRFAKKYFAVLLQGLMVVLVIFACRLIQASIMKNNDLMGGSIGTVGYVLALRLAQLKLVQQSQQFASDVVGG